MTYPGFGEIHVYDFIHSYVWYVQCNQHFNVILMSQWYFVGPFPSNDKPEGPYPTIVDHGSSKTLVLQDYFAGKYLGFINVTFDSNNHMDSWEGLPILLDNSTKQGKEKQTTE